MNTHVNINIWDYEHHQQSIHPFQVHEELQKVTHEIEIQTKHTEAL